MQHTIIEIKARSDNHSDIRKKLKDQKAVFIGTDHQIDTYFKVNFGRLKLREGEIENHLIHYKREDKSGPKESDVTLFNSNPKSSLKKILTNALGVLAVVNKTREIYFINNVKFHLDTVIDLGSFVEIEAINTEKNNEKEKLLEQCQFYLSLFNILEKDLIPVSYSDMLIKK